MKMVFCNIKISRNTSKSPSQIPPRAKALWPRGPGFWSMVEEVAFSNTPVAQGPANFESSEALKLSGSEALDGWFPLLEKTQGLHSKTCSQNNKTNPAREARRQTFLKALLFYVEEGRETFTGNDFGRRVEQRWPYYFLCRRLRHTLCSGLRPARRAEVALLFLAE